MIDKITKYLRNKANYVWSFILEFKEEAISIPILCIAIWLYKLWMRIFYPNDHQLNVSSQVDYMFTAVWKLIVFTLVSWIAMRIVFPNIYKYLKYEFSEFSQQVKEEEKRKYSLIIFFAFLFALVLMS